ncbi:MAG: hypothetical protein ACI8W8_001187 [Rhodothermales bacterium]|jgi:hypothetical protein
MIRTINATYRLIFAIGVIPAFTGAAEPWRPITKGEVFAHTEVGLRMALPEHFHMASAEAMQASQQKLVDLLPLNSEPELAFAQRAMRLLEIRLLPASIWREGNCGLEIKVIEMGRPIADSPTADADVILAAHRDFFDGDGIDLAEPLVVEISGQSFAAIDASEKNESGTLLARTFFGYHGRFGMTIKLVGTSAAQIEMLDAWLYEHLALEVAVQPQADSSDYFALEPSAG